jgi:hypothetical protein
VLGFSDYFGIRHRRSRDQLTDMLANPHERAGEITIHFVGDTNPAAQFARSVPDFGLKGRFADLVKLDLQALEQEIGSTSRRRGPGGAASFGGERRLVEFPRGKPIPPPRANAQMKPPRPTGAWLVSTRPRNRRLSGAELKVRIHLPPAKSPRKPARRGARG